MRPRSALFPASLAGVVLICSAALAGAAIRDVPLPVNAPGLSTYSWDNPIASWDGALWVGGSGTGGLLRIGTDGAVTQHPIPMDSDAVSQEGPTTLSAGAEGLWFLSQAGRIAQFRAADGSHTGFPVEGFVGASTLVARPGGGVYVASNLGEWVRFVSPSAIREYPREHGDQPVLAIGAGDVGWVAEEGRLTRLNDDGTVTTFPLANPCTPSVGCALPAVTGMARGRDGNLWYTRSGLRSRATGPYSGTTDDAAIVGRMTPTGRAREWDLANNEIGPSGIVAGPDGNMWFATGDGLGRVAPSGRVRLMRLPGGRTADAITFGPDRAIWFTDSRLNRVSRITTAEANALAGAEIRSTTLRRRAGTIPVTVRCPVGGTRCTGKVTLAAVPNPDAVFGRRQSWGSTRFTLRPGRATTVRVRPTAQLNQRLRRAARVPVRVEIDRGTIQGDVVDTTVRR